MHVLALMEVGFGPLPHAMERHVRIVGVDCMCVWKGCMCLEASGTCSVRSVCGLCFLRAV